MGTGMESPPLPADRLAAQLQRQDRLNNALHAASVANVTESMDFELDLIKADAKHIERELWGAESFETDDMGDRYIIAGDVKLEQEKPTASLAAKIAPAALAAVGLLGSGAAIAWGLAQRAAEQPAAAEAQDNVAVLLPDN